jgi:hypothetical protein
MVILCRINSCINSTVASIQEGDSNQIKMYLARLMGLFGADPPQLIHPGSENLSLQLERYR